LPVICSSLEPVVFKSFFLEYILQFRNHSGFCPGFSECRVFSAGMKIVVDKNLENTFGNVFESFLARFYELYMHI
jgi:hypothetical protein